MQALVSFFTLLTVLTRRIGVCGNVGLVAGAVAGTSLTWVDMLHGGISLTTPEILKVSLLFSLFAWVVVMFFLVVLARLTLQSTGLPALVNVILTCTLTVYLAVKLPAFPVAWLLGIALGVLVGTMLCRVGAVLRSLGDRDK